MAREIHVWLLHAGRPASAAEAPDWARRVWADRAWTPGLPGWWRPLWIWWRARQAAPERALTGAVAGALSGPTAPSAEELEHQLTDELQRCMGAGTVVKLVPRWPEEALQRAARDLTMGVRVVLLPLVTLPDGAAADAMLASAAAVLDPRRKVARAPALTVQDGVIDVLAASVRTGLIELGAQGPVPVLFVARAAPAPGREAAYVDQAERLAQAVAREAKLAGPAELAFHDHGWPWGGPEPRAAAVLKDWSREGHAAALVVSLDELGPIEPVGSALSRLVAAAPLRAHLAPRPGARPLFRRCLEAARAAAETRAGWDDA